jgi:hypothetical protein
MVASSDTGAMDAKIPEKLCKEFTYAEHTDLSCILP